MVFSWAWILWVVLFFAIEGLALATKTQGATLSAHIASWMGDNTIRIWLILAFIVWLGLHFLKGRL